MLKTIARFVIGAALGCLLGAHLGGGSPSLAELSTCLGLIAAGALTLDDDVRQGVASALELLGELAHVAD